MTTTLRQELDTLRDGAKPQSLRRKFFLGVGTTVSGAALVFAGAFSNAYISAPVDPGSQCAAQLKDVAVAVAEKVNDPAVLQGLAREGCAVSPEQMARDINGG